MPSSRRRGWWCPFATEPRAPEPRAPDARARACAGAIAIAAFAGAAGWGCSGQTCGPTGDDSGITLTVAGQTATFTEFTASANNDCPSPGHPTAVTVSGTQQNASGSIILCLSTPDEVGGSEPLTFGGNVQLVSVSAQLDCPVIVDRGEEPGAAAIFDGYCGNGTDAAGFTLALAGDLAMTQECQDGDTAVMATLQGSATVSVP